MADGTRAHIAVGSNIEPESHVTRALSLLAEQVALRAVSSFYRVAPLGRPEQADFLNGVCAIETRLDARSLKFGVLREVEEALGRRRTEDRYAARTIDLDVVLFGDVVVNEPDLIIPDPELRERPFLAFPMLELEPDLVLPDTGELLRDVAGRLSRNGLVAELAFTQSLKARLHL